jgi:hypothetical protein
MSNTTFEIEKLYIEFFDRPADAGGLQFWTNAVNSGLSIADVAHAMEQSAEYKTHFTDQWSTGVSSSVDHAFMHMFDRHATMSELNTWGYKYMDALVNHRSTADVIMQIGDAASGADLQHFMEKVTDALPVGVVGVQSFDFQMLAA